MPIHNPEEAAAAGKQIATGTYVGNNADDRQITTGFKCSFVMLAVAFDSTWYCHWWAYANSLVFRIQADTHVHIATDLQLHAADGFEVDRVEANHSAQTYYYWAISE